MIERTFDYRKIKGKLMWGMIISSKIIYLIDGDQGLWSFVPNKEDSKTMEMHVYLNPSCRGKEGVQKCKKAIQWIFDNTDITVILGLIPKENRPSCVNAIHSGLKFTHEIENKRVYEVRKQL